MYVGVKAEASEASVVVTVLTYHPVGNRRGSRFASLRDGV